LRPVGRRTAGRLGPTGITDGPARTGRRIGGGLGVVPQHSVNPCLVRGVSGLLKPEKVQVSPLDACDVLRKPSFRQVRLLSDEVDTRASICASWANPESMAVIAPPSTPVRRALGAGRTVALSVIMRGCVLGGRRRTFARVRSGRGGLTCEPGTVRSFREPSIWRTRGPGLINGSGRANGTIGTARRSEHVAPHRASHRSRNREHVEPSTGHPDAPQSL
jgi:hypothetical protein